MFSSKNLEFKDVHNVKHFVGGLRWKRNSICGSCWKPSINTCRMIFHSVPWKASFKSSISGRFNQTFSHNKTVLSLLSSRKLFFCLFSEHKKTQKAQLQPVGEQKLTVDKFNLWMSIKRKFGWVSTRSRLTKRFAFTQQMIEGNDKPLKGGKTSLSF